MTNDALEIYLEELFAALSPISVSERAEIITKIKTQIISKSDSEKTDLSEVLNEMGSPTTLADIYLDEKGLKRGKKHKKKHSKEDKVSEESHSEQDDHDHEDDTIHVKDFGHAAQDFFSKMISFDKDNVKLFGGAIDINSKDGRIKFGDTVIDGRSQIAAAQKAIAKNTYRGKINLQDNDERLITIKWNVGKVHIVTHDSNEFSWKWNGVPFFHGSPITETDDEIQLNLGHFGPGKGTIFIPARCKIKVHGDAGKLKFRRPENTLSAYVGVGKIEILQHPLLQYKWDLQTDVGKIDHVESSEDPNAIKVKARVNTGKIEIETAELCES